MNNYKNKFANLQAKIEELKKDESDLSGSYGELHTDSFFLLKNNYRGMKPKENTARYNILYNYIKKRYIHKKLELSTVVLLDNKSTMELLWNTDLVENKKAKGNF